MTFLSMTDTHIYICVYTYVHMHITRIDRALCYALENKNRWMLFFLKFMWSLKHSPWFQLHIFPIYYINWGGSNQCTKLPSACRMTRAFVRPVAYLVLQKKKTSELISEHVILKSFWRGYAPLLAAAWLHTISALCLPLSPNLKCL